MLECSAYYANMSGFQGYVVKALHADDVEETLPPRQPMVDAVEKQNVPCVSNEDSKQNAIVVSGQ